MPEGHRAVRLGGQEAGKLNVLRRGMMEEERWQKLEVWKHADELAFLVYKVTKDFPKEEVYGITSQVRRAALSIPTNIVEGYSRKGDKELARFVNISLGSLAETKYLLYFSNRLGYFEKGEYNELKNGYDTLGKLLWKFYAKIKTN
jgi:four helix bundle protein